MEKGLKLTKSERRENTVNGKRDTYDKQRLMQKGCCGEKKQGKLSNK